MSEPGYGTLEKRSKSPRFGSRALWALAIAGVFFAATSAYFHATGYYFSQDDFTFLARSIGLSPHPGFLSPLGARIISTRLYFEIMHGLYGLNPAPYHWASLLLHSLNAVLVVLLAGFWTRRRAPAIVAGFLFATFDLAFTAVFWISGVQDLLATTFLLLSALVWAANTRNSPSLSILSAAALALSLLCKEIGVLFPLVLATVSWARGVWGRRSALGLIPHTTVSLAAVLLFLVQSLRVSEGGAYGFGVSVEAVFNLATYIVWTFDVIHPFKDLVAAIDYGAWKTALAIAAVAATVLVILRGQSRRIAISSFIWYGLMLAPVLPLLHHTYLYYLYPASVGAAVVIGVLLVAISEYLSGRFRGAISIAVIATAALCLLGTVNTRTRERTLLGPDFVLPRDHVLRSAELARNSAITFAESEVPEGSDLLLINPYGAQAVDLSEDAPSGSERVTFDMIRMALREGEVLRVLRPDLGDVAFTRRMESRWEARQGLLYDAYGRFTYLGSGADIWANLSTVHLLRTSQLDESIRCSRRALEMNPSHPRATLNLGIALAMTGLEREARGYLTRAVETSPTESMRATASQWLDSLGEGN